MFATYQDMRAAGGPWMCQGRCGSTLLRGPGRCGKCDPTTCERCGVVVPNRGDSPGMTSVHGVECITAEGDAVVSINWTVWS